MKLKDFMACSLEASITADGDLPKEAGRIFKANYAVPAYTSIRFTFSAIVDGTHPRHHHFNLLLKIKPDHPYFRPYLKDWAIRKTCHLCSLESFDELFDNARFLYCQYGPETELDTIVNDTEKCIIDRVVQFETCLHTLNDISVQHGLSPDNISSLMKAMDYMLKHSLLDENYLLNAENRNELLLLKT